MIVVKFRRFQSLIVGFFDFDRYWIACAFLNLLLCVSEFILIVISPDRRSIFGCSMSFDFWLFVCRLIFEIFEVCAFRGSLLCFSSVT